MNLHDTVTVRARHLLETIQRVDPADVTGWNVTCRCGWTYLRAPTPTAAIEAHARHVTHVIEQEAPNHAR